MTYPDRQRVRAKRRTIRLDDYEDGLVEALAKFQGEQVSTLLRDMVVRQAKAAMSTNGAPDALFVERRQG